MTNRTKNNKAKIQYQDTDGSYYEPVSRIDAIKILATIIFAGTLLVGSIVGMAMGWIPVK